MVVSLSPDEKLFSKEIKLRPQMMYPDLVSVLCQRLKVWARPRKNIASKKISQQTSAQP